MTKTPTDVREEVQVAAAFANDPSLLAAFAAATREDKAWNRATKNAKDFLREQGVTAPPGLAVQFLDPSSPTKPAPDWDGQPHRYFIIRLSQCRTYWLKKRDEPGYEEVEFCREFVIVPQPIPGGPIA